MPANIPEGLPQIGPRTRDLLRRQGIRTNRDLLRRQDDLAELPGIGPQRASTLLEWAETSLSLGDRAELSRERAEAAHRAYEHMVREVERAREQRQREAERRAQRLADETRKARLRGAASLVALAAAVGIGLLASEDPQAGVGVLMVGGVVFALIDSVGKPSNRLEGKFVGRAEIVSLGAWLAFMLAAWLAAIGRMEPPGVVLGWAAVLVSTDWLGKVVERARPISRRPDVAALPETDASAPEVPAVSHDSDHPWYLEHVYWMRRLLQHAGGPMTVSEIVQRTASRPFPDMPRIPFNCLTSKGMVEMLVEYMMADGYVTLSEGDRYALGPQELDDERRVPDYWRESDDDVVEGASAGSPLADAILGDLLQTWGQGDPGTTGAEGAEGASLPKGPRGST